MDPIYIQKVNTRNDNIVVIKSTIIPGTTRSLVNEFEDLNFVFNPEFLTERHAKYDFLNQARIVLGGYRDHTQRVAELYKLRFKHCNIMETDFNTAEFIKYFNNVFFSVKVAFANEVIDSDSAYDPSTNYRFTVPSGKGGTYKVEFGFWLADSASKLQKVEGYIYKNGVELFKLRSQHNADGEYAGYVNLSSIAVLSASDYLEVYVYIEEATSGSSEISGSGNNAKFRNFFSGYKLLT